MKKYSLLYSQDVSEVLDGRTAEEIVAWMAEHSTSGYDRVYLEYDVTAEEIDLYGEREETPDEEQARLLRVGTSRRTAEEIKRHQIARLKAELKRLEEYVG